MSSVECCAKPLPCLDFVDCLGGDWALEVGGVPRLGFRVWGSGFRVQGFGF